MAAESLSPSREKVRFTTYDGVALVGDLYVPGHREGWLPGLVVCHGFGSSKEEHAPFAEMAAAAGFVTLVANLRGHGESAGELDGNVFNDVAAAHTFLQERPEVDPLRVGIRGSSMGGWLAIHTVAHLPDLAPVVAYCPVNEVYFQRLLEEIAMVRRGHASPLMAAITATPPRVDLNSMSELLRRVDLQKAAARISPRNLLLVQCEGDEVVPAHIAQRIYEAAREPRTLWLLPGGDHNFAQQDPDTNRRVLEWMGLASAPP